MPAPHLLPDARNILPVNHGWIMSLRERHVASMQLPSFQVFLTAVQPKHNLYIIQAPAYLLFSTN
jgi:hypothetical protein